MAMLNESALRRLFRARLKTVSTLPPEARLAWEGRSFTPPDPNPGDLWVREFVSILGESKSSTGFIEATGTTTYAVFTPGTGGTEDADALAQAVAEAFEAGQSLTADGLTAIIERTERAPYRDSADDRGSSLWIFKTVTIRWRVFTPVSS